MFYPKISTGLGFSNENPSTLMQICLEDSINEAVEILSPQGGSINPEHYFIYENTKAEYLCYSSEYYKTCIVQRPLLKKHIENEISRAIDSEAKKCFDSMKQSLEKKGYIVDAKYDGFEVELLPKRISVIFNNSLTISKQETETFEAIGIAVNNNLYELISIANSILAWEAKYGDAETTIYMNYYHDLKVEKKKHSDGTTVYILTDRNNGNKFMFASRSVAWPPGYGTKDLMI
jgi:hypothetical protein